MSTDVHVIEEPIIPHTLYEINRPDWLSKYWEILCSKDPDEEIEKANKDSALPLFLRTNPFKLKKPQTGHHEIEVGKLVFVPVSVSEFDEVEARHFNLGSIDTPEERLAYARDEYELAIDKPKQLSINGHRLLDREGIYGPYYAEVRNFKLTVDKESKLYNEFDIPYEDDDLGNTLDATIIGHCVVLELPEGKFTISSYSEGPFGEWTACNYLINVNPKK
jgi:hypothetical protein